MPGPKAESTTTCAIDWNGRRLVLRGDGSMVEPACATVYVADVHLGKAAAFRAAGVAAPGGVDAAGLARLDATLDATDATRLVILGDLFHARAGRSAALDEAFVAWRRGWSSVDVVLVRGNHDRAAGDPPAAADVRCVDEPWSDAATGGRCAHDPAAVDADGPPAMFGHVHPCVSLRASGGRLRARCFVVGGRTIMLPAFGPFTGGGRIAPADEERIFVLVDGGVAEATHLASGRGQRVM